MHKRQRDLCKFVDRVLGRGKYALEINGRGHIKIIFGDGSWFSCPYSPSDWRSMKNFEKQFQRRVKNMQDGIPA